MVVVTVVGITTVTAYLNVSILKYADGAVLTSGIRVVVVSTVVVCFFISSAKGTRHYRWETHTTVSVSVSVAVDVGASTVVVSVSVASGPSVISVVVVVLRESSDTLLLL